VETTIVQLNLDIENRIASQGAFGHHAAETLLDSREEFLGNVAAHHHRFEDEAGAGLAGTDTVIDLTELTGTTGLLLVSVGIIDFLGDGFAVSDLRLADDHFHLDVQVKLAHALENGFA